MLFRDNRYQNISVYEMIKNLHILGTNDITVSPVDDNDSLWIYLY